jgi:hypothetical protein
MPALALAHIGTCPALFFTDRRKAWLSGNREHPGSNMNNALGRAGRRKDCVWGTRQA